MNDGAYDPEVQGPRGYYAHYVLGLLLIIYILNQTDRSLFPFLMQPIKSEFHLTDTQLGFLAGPALSVLYTVLGIPVARWADRSHRVSIMSGAIALWSTVILAFATVSTFWQLALAQGGLGIGEAGFTAVAISVIADYYPEHSSRMRALSIFNLAIPIAGVVSGLFAGWVNQTYGWRDVFVAAAVPGLLLAVLMKCTIREPARRELAGATPPSGPNSLRQIFETLWRERALRHLVAGAFLANLVACLLNWLPTFLVRARGMDTSEVGLWNAAISGIGGGAGIWLSGRISGGPQSVDIGRTMRTVAVATGVAFPTLVLSLWCSSESGSLLALIASQALVYFFLTPTLATVQMLCAPKIRATMVSLFILVIVAGAILSVQLVGALSDVLTTVLHSDSQALQWSLTTMSMLSIWAAMHFWLFGRSVPVRTHA